MPVELRKAIEKTFSLVLHGKESHRRAMWEIEDIYAQTHDRLRQPNRN